MFAPEALPDSEARSIAKSCFRYWTLQAVVGLSQTRVSRILHDDGPP